MRLVHLAVFLSLLALAPLARAQGGCGTIDSTGSTIAVGTAAIPGTRIVDPCLPGGTQPVLPPRSIGPLGTLTGTMPAFPGGGTGADGAFHATSNQTLAGGTYNFTTYTVDLGVVVTYTGAVTIHTTGDMTLNGRIETSGADRSVEVRCAGNLTIAGGPAGVAGFNVSGARADLTVFVDGALTAPDRHDIIVDGGDLLLSVHRAPGASPAVTLDGSLVRCDQGDLHLRARGEIWCRSVYIAGETSTLVQSFEDGITQTGSGSITGGTNTPIRVEAYGTVDLGNGSYVEGSDGTVDVLSHRGEVRATAATISSYDGDLTITAYLDMLILDGTGVSTEAGTLRMTGRSAVYLGYDGVSVESEAYVRSDAQILLECNYEVQVRGDSRVEAKGALTITTLEGPYTQTSNAEISGESVTVRAGAGLTVQAGIGAAAIEATGSAGSIDLSSGSGITLDLEYVRAGNESLERGGDLRILTDGPIVLSGLFEAFMDVYVVTRHGSMDISGATIRSYDRTQTTTGSVLVESWRSAGHIDASGARITSGDTPDDSGDVTVCVRGVSEPDEVTESFILPKKIRVKQKEGKPEKSKLSVTGFFDMGPDQVDLTKAATLHVGGTAVAVPGLTRSGSSYVYEQDGVTMKITPNKSGSSRAKFKLKAKGSLADAVDTDGVLDLRFQSGDVDGQGSCRISKGKFTLQKVRGSLITPLLHLSKVRCKIKGEVNDKLKLRTGLATDGTTPSTAPDVTIRFGPVVAMIPSTSFSRDGDRYVFEGDIQGVTDVELDYSRETVNVVGKELDLSSFAQGATSVLVSVEVGDDEHAIRVRMVRDGKKLRY